MACTMEENTITIMITNFPETIGPLQVACYHRVNDKYLANNMYA